MVALYETAPFKLRTGVYNCPDAELKRLGNIAIEESTALSEKRKHLLNDLLEIKLPSLDWREVCRAPNGPLSQRLNRLYVPIHLVSLAPHFGKQQIKLIDQPGDSTKIPSDLSELLMNLAEAWDLNVQERTDVFGAKMIFPLVRANVTRLRWVL